MGKTLIVWLLIGISVILIHHLLVMEGQAIPAFARKYETSCSTCHVAIPKRNASGEAFRKNGYEIPQGDEIYTKQEQVALGAPAWKEVWPDGLWPNDIPQSFPFSAYVHQRLVLDFKKDDDGTDIRPTFDAPHEFELLLGGTLGEGIGFLGEWVAFEKMKNAAGLKSIYIQFNDLLGPEDAFNVRVGRFEPGVTRGYTDNDRVTMEHIMTWDYRVATKGSKWRMRDKQAGVELNGILSQRLEYNAGIVNGDGTTLDQNKMKDFFGRVGYKLGGMPLNGEEEAPEDLQATDNWVDDSLSVGAYAYVGDSVLPADDGTYENSFFRVGADVKAMYQNLDVRGGLIIGNDDNPDNDNKEVSSTAFFVEADYLVKPWLMGVVRYGSVSFDGARDDYQKLSPNITVLARANIRMSAEAYIKLDDNDDNSVLQWIKLNILYAF